jgi:hypothetical protein
MAECPFHCGWTTDDFMSDLELAVVVGGRDRLALHLEFEHGASVERIKDAWEERRAMAHKINGRPRPAAPSHSCIACFRGDTTTGLTLIGRPEFQVAVLTAVGVSMEEACATVQAESHRQVMSVRVCVDCAARARMEVAPIAGLQLPAYREGDQATVELPAVREWGE